MLIASLKTYITPPKSSSASLHSALPISFLHNYVLFNECLLPFSRIGRMSVMFFFWLLRSNPEDPHGFVRSENSRTASGIWCWKPWSARIKVEEDLRYDSIFKVPITTLALFVLGAPQYKIAPCLTVFPLKIQTLDAMLSGIPKLHGPRKM
jgi:hypothetical protein